MPSPSSPTNDYYENRLIASARACAAAGEICDEAGRATGNGKAGHSNVAERAYQAAFDEYSDQAEQLLTAPARSLEGLQAKTRAFSSLFADDAALGAAIASRMNRFGIDDEVCALSLARDVLRLFAKQP